MIIGVIIAVIFIGLMTWFLLNKYVLTKEKKTPDGMLYKCDSELTEDYLKYLDSCLGWARNNGLDAKASSIRLNIINGQKDANGYFWYCMPDGTKIAGQLTSSPNPICVDMCKQTPEVLRHELNHLIIFNKTNDFDPNHKDASWAKVYEGVDFNYGRNL